MGPKAEGRFGLNKKGDLWRELVRLWEEEKVANFDASFLKPGHRGGVTGAIPC